MATIVAVCVVSAAVGLPGQTAQGPGSQGTAAGAAPAAGRGQLPTSVAAEVNGFYTRIAGFITRSLTMVPEDKLKYQPTPEVRSFARLFGHIIDDNNRACWSLAGLAQALPAVDTPNSAESAANKMTKADLQKGLEDSVALCQKAFAAVTPANMMESAGGRGTQTKIGALIYNTSHINEHYGNLVTYLRLNNMVPPSSGGGRGGN
jgi:hypothetical protein